MVNVAPISTVSVLPAAEIDDPATTMSDGVETDNEREVVMAVSLYVRTGPTVETLESKLPTTSTATTAT